MEDRLSPYVSAYGSCSKGLWIRGCLVDVVMFFFFKQKTAYEIVSRDWSSDVCSSDLTMILVPR